MKDPKAQPPTSKEDMNNHVDMDMVIDVRRPVYHTKEFREKFKKPPAPDRNFREIIGTNLSNWCSCSKSRCKGILLDSFPFLKIMQKYKVKTDLPNDIIAGLTVGIMQLPQSMAYALLADLPPIVGLYVSFFPILVYFFFGTSRHAAMGTVAVVSLLIGSVVSTLEVDPTISLNATLVGANGTALDDTDTALHDELNQRKIRLAGAITFMAGIVQIILGYCKLGVVTTYMSDSLVSGFTTGAAVHVFTSQVKYVFGLRIRRFSGVFQLVLTYVEIFKNIHKTNLADMTITFICMIIIYLVKVQVNQRFKDKLKVPVPIDLFVVIAATLTSHYENLHERYNIRIVGKIPAGLPAPNVPAFDQGKPFVADAIVIGIVAFAQSVSLATLMAKKHNYDIDANKELKAYGFGNIFGSFFSCYPFAASVSRTSVQDSAGGRTQLTNVFSCVLVLIVILVIGPLFEDLPNCVLSAIIWVALRTMLLQILELKRLWKISKYDFSIWLVTFLSVVILHVDYGLGIGIIFSAFTVVIRSQRTNMKLYGKIEDSNIYRNEKDYVKSVQQADVRIVYYNSPVYFANADIFVRQIHETSGVRPEKVLKKMKVMEKERSKAEFSKVVEADGQTTVPNADQNEMKLDLSISCIIIDCSAMNFIDTVGIKVFEQLSTDYSKIGIKILYADIKDPVYAVLEASGFIEKFGGTLYLSIEDAVQAITYPAYASESGVAKPEDRLL